MMTASVHWAGLALIVRMESACSFFERREIKFFIALLFEQLFETGALQNMAVTVPFLSKSGKTVLALKGAIQPVNAEVVDHVFVGRANSLAPEAPELRTEQARIRAELVVPCVSSRGEGLVAVVEFVQLAIQTFPSPNAIIKRLQRTCEID